MRTNRLLGLLWGGGSVLLIALGAWVPEAVSFLPRCPFKATSGIPCFICGSGRASQALARGDFTEAFFVNPLATVLLVLFVGGGVLAGALALMGARVPEPPRWLAAWGRWVSGFVILANWVYLLIDGR